MTEFAAIVAQPGNYPALFPAYGNSGFGPLGQFGSLTVNGGLGGLAVEAVGHNILLTGGNAVSVLAAQFDGMLPHLFVMNNTPLVPIVNQPVDNLAACIRPMGANVTFNEINIGTVLSQLAGITYLNPGFLEFVGGSIALDQLTPPPSPGVPGEKLRGLHQGLPGPSHKS